jgi:hypothetical protein
MPKGITNVTIVISARGLSIFHCRWHGDSGVRFLVAGTRMDLPSYDELARLRTRGDCQILTAVSRLSLQDLVL